MTGRWKDYRSYRVMRTAFLNLNSRLSVKDWNKLAQWIYEYDIIQGECYARHRARSGEVATPSGKRSADPSQGTSGPTAGSRVRREPERLA